MTDTTNGATGEPRDGDVTETPAATTPEEPATTPEEPATAPPATGTVYEPGQEPHPYRAPHYEHQAPGAAAAASAGQQAPAAPAAGTPAAAAAPAASESSVTPETHAAPASPVATGAPTASTGSAPAPGHVPPAFGGPQHTQPTMPIDGSHAQGAGATDATGAPAAPKQRRVGLGVAAAIVAAALIGGASGAGVTALISNNDGVVSNDSAGVESIVVNDTDSVNQITAVAAKASESVVTISVSSGQGGGTGSGIILSDDGFVLTNTHVVTLDGETADPSIKVKTSDGRLFDAELVGTDPLSDLAVIKLAGASDLTPLEFADSDDLNVGDTAIAIGAPMGLAGTVTNGIVSALNRSIDVASSAAPTTPDDGGDEGNGQDGSESPFDFWNFEGPEGGEQRQQQQGTGQISIPVIQTDAAINPGNSGGALLDSEGNLIGVNVAILSAGGAQTEAGNIGVGFAVPSNLAERVAKEIIENGSATHGLLGATVTAAESDAASTMVGALISEVSSGGAAEAAGLEAGDVVTEFNGVPITDQTDLTAQVRALPGGAEAELTYIRGGESRTASVTLGTFEG